MNYLIDPMFFYWADVFAALKMFLSIGGTIVVILGTIAFFCELSDNGEYVKKIVITILIALTLLIGSFFIPSKEVMYQMATASLITTENINIAKEEGKEITKFITEQLCTIIEEVKK